MSAEVVLAAAAATQKPEPPDRSLVALVDPSDREVPWLFERDDTAARAVFLWPDDDRRWFPGDAEADIERVHTWQGLLARAAEVGATVVRLYREDDPAITVHAEAGETS